MSLGQTLRKSYRDLQNSWTRLADSAFGKADTGRQDEMARGEFISAFISERDLSFPPGSPRAENGKLSPSVVKWLSPWGRHALG